MVKDDVFSFCLMSDLGLVMPARLPALIFPSLLRFLSSAFYNCLYGGGHTMLTRRSGEDLDVFIDYYEWQCEPRLREEVPNYCLRSSPSPNLLLLRGGWSAVPPSFLYCCRC